MQQNTSNYPAQRLAGHEHIPLYPKGFVAIRFVQLVLGVLALAITAYLLAVTIAYTGDCLMVFTAVANLIVTVYYIVAALGPKNIYNYWAVLSLDVFMLVFWLISFAVLASEAAFVFSAIYDYSSYCDGYYSYYCDDSVYTKAFTIYADCMAAASGLGAMLFVTYIISLAIHSVVLHRHRAAGLHCTPGSAGAAAAGAVMANEKAQPVATVHPAYQSGMPPYLQQPQQNAGVPGFPMSTMAQPPQQWQHPQHPQQYQQAAAFQPEPSYQGSPSPVTPMNSYPQPEQTPSPIPAQLTGASYAAPPPATGAHQLSAAPANQFAGQQHQIIGPPQ